MPAVVLAIRGQRTTLVSRGALSSETTRFRLAAIGALFALFALCGCEFPARSERYACDTDSDCEQGRTCDEGYCVVSSSADAGTDSTTAPADGAADADTATLLAARCPPAGYTLATGPNGYYRVVTAGTSWTNAKTACAADVPGSTHLIVLSSSAEVSFAASQVGGTQGWIGLSDSAAEGQFVTVTGETGDLRPWASGEPNNAGGEDCAALKANGQLDDRPCGSGYRYICECDGRASL